MKLCIKSGWDSEEYRKRPQRKVSRAQEKVERTPLT
jgi:hypothetical protein